MKTEKIPKSWWTGELCPLIPRYKKNAKWIHGFAMSSKADNGELFMNNKEINEADPCEFFDAETGERIEGDLVIYHTK